MRLFSKLRRRRRHSFTLVEVLVSLAILLVILVVVLQFVDEVDQAWKSAAADPFAEAQDAFETIVKNLSAATLNPYQDYADISGAFRTNSSFVPDHLARRSDLDFVCGPSAGTNGLIAPTGRITTGNSLFFLTPRGYTQTEAHLGMERLLNATGYLVEFGDDQTVPGFILSQTHFWRWRLKQVLQPSESLQIFASTSSAAWIQQIVPSGAPIPVLAENIVTLLILPERAASDSGPALAPFFSYDSRDAGNLLTLHQLPPRVRVVLVAMDPASAQRLAGQDGSNPPALVPSILFQQASQLDADLATLDGSLTAQKIGHRIFQREILLPSSAWSDTPSP
jgi:uncharacterized protein (TIGR02599 family)